MATRIRFDTTAGVSAQGKNNFFSFLGYVDFEKHFISNFSNPKRIEISKIFFRFEFFFSISSFS